MNKKIAQMWTSALRSGDYKQGAYHLYDRGAFCCLGVLCDIHARETESGWEESDNCSQQTYIGAADFLPQEVIEWAGMKSKNGEISGTSLAYLNDEKNFDFNTIAHMIDENWEVL